MLEILLFGVALVVIYLVSHTLVMRVERWRGRPLGGWRSVLFFAVFLLLTLIAFQLLPMLLGSGAPA
jgi:multisubunit Na+/H+ antiporter MnhB subunit